MDQDSYQPVHDQTMLPGNVPAGARPVDLNAAPPVYAQPPPTQEIPPQATQEQQPQPSYSGQYVPPVQNIYITQQVQNAPGIAVAVGPQKSMTTALLLSFLFGPLGLFYASVPGGIVMLIASLIIVIPTFGVGLLFTVPACMIWAAIATNNYNARFTQPTANQTQIGR